MKSFIIKMILFALLLFIAYNFFIVVANPETAKGQHQWQKNVIEAQEYIYEYQGVENVLVGSSLSFRIDNNMLPKHFYNLSLGGGSIFTGLEIIKRCQKKPKTIFIESNFIIRPGDEKFAEELFRPVVWKAKSYIPALREKYQPVNVLMPFVTRHILSKPKMPSANKEQVPDSTIYNKLLQNYINDHQKLPDTALLHENFALLKEYIHYFDEHGVGIIFYQLPVHCKIEATPYNKALYIETLNAFPNTIIDEKGEFYNWLPPTNCKDYTYNDGEHLSYESAQRFAKWKFNF